MKVFSIARQDFEHLHSFPYWFSSSVFVDQEWGNQLFPGFLRLLLFFFYFLFGQATWHEAETEAPILWSHDAKS